MHTSTRLSGQYCYQVGQPSQHTNGSSQLSVVTANVPQPQSVQFTPHNGAYFGQTSTWQASTVPQQAPARGIHNYHQMNSTQGNEAIHTSYTNAQSGNLPLPEKLNGVPQTAIQQTFYQNSPLQPNAALFLKNFTSTSNWSQQTLMHGNQYTFSQNSSVASAQQEQMPSTGTSASVTTYNTRIPHNQHQNSGFRTNSIQDGAFFYTALPNQMSSSQFLRSNSHDLTPGQCLPTSGMEHQTQNCGREANSSSHTQANSNGSQVISSLYFSKMNNFTASTAAGTRQVLPNPTHDSQLSTQYMLKPPPPYGSVPGGFCASVPEDGTKNGFKADNAIFHGNKVNSPVQKRELHNLKGSLFGKFSLWENKTQLPAARNVEQPQTPANLKDHNNCTSLQKAVAVVQPLSQESYPVVSKEGCSVIINQCKHTTTDNCVCATEKLNDSPEFGKRIITDTLIPDLKDDHVCLENSKEAISSNADAGPSDCGAVATASCIAVLKDTVQNNLHAEGMESQLSNGMQSEVTAAPESVTTEEPQSPSRDMDKNDRQEDPEVEFIKLSSVPLISWTHDKLLELIEKATKLQMQSEDLSKSNATGNVLSIFWEDSFDKFLTAVHTQCYNKIMAKVKEFSYKHVTPDSIIFSQVMHPNWKLKLKDCHVLKHDAVPPEVPYMSSWLNNNEQLNDIDEEFGFPCSLKCLNTLDRVNQPKLIATYDDMPAHAVREIQKEVTPPTELEMVRSDEDDVEKLTLASTNTSTQIVAPKSTEGTDSSDPCYSFKIQVLPPDEAKMVFEQIESEKTDSQSENIMNVSADDEFAEVIDVKSSEAKSEGNKSQSTIKEFCCLTSWMEDILGSNKLLLSKCQCKQQTVSKDLVVKCFEDEGKAELYPTMEDESKANADDAQPSISTCTEQAILISDIIDLTGDAEILHSRVNVEPNAGSGQSTSTNTRENEIVNLPSSSEGEKHITHSLIQNLLNSKLASADKTNVVGGLASPSLGQKNCYSTGTGKILKAKKKSVGKKQRKLMGPVPLLKKTVEFKAPLDRFEDEGKAELYPTMEDESKANADDAQPSISTCTEQAILISDIIDLTGDAEILHSRVNVEPNAGSGQSTSTNTRENEIVNLPSSSEGEKHISHSLIQKLLNSKLTSADKTNVVGDLASPSLGQNNCYSTGTGKILKAKKKSVGKKQRKLMGPVPLLKKAVEFEAPLDPNLEPALQGISTHINKEIVDTGDLISADRTVKLALFGSSRQRKYVLNSCGKSHVSQLENFSGQAPEVISVNLNSKQQSPSETVSMSKCPVKRRIHEEWKNSLVPIKKKQKVHTQKNCTSDSLSNPPLSTPLKMNNVLRFSVLPSTFNFKEGHTGTEDSVLDVPDCVDTNDESSKMTVKRPRGTWAPHPETADSSLPSSSIPVTKTTTIFQEFQKRYREKKQLSVDE